MKQSRKSEEGEKSTALRFFELIGQGRMKEARGLFATNCKHHNPYVADGMDALLDSMVKAQSDEEDMPRDLRLNLGHTLVEGNMVATYTTCQSKSNPSKGFRQVHLFRFRSGKIVEYWDVTQIPPKNSPNLRRMF